jgi:Ca2+-binding EF-hand superfamily protein
MFVFAIVFMGATAEFFDAVDLSDANQVASAQAVNALFGDIANTSLSLWSAISGGNDWMTYGEQLQKFSNPMYFYIFLFYIAFCCVGLFNVVTGVFVDSAVCVRTEDEIVAGYFEELRATTDAIKAFFKDADKDGSGALSWEEFSTRMHDPAVIAYFAGLDIDPQEAGIIFAIFDADKSNSIQIDELVNGTMKLKGSASKLDLMALMYDANIQSMKIDNLVKTFESVMHNISNISSISHNGSNNRRKDELMQHYQRFKDLPRGQVLSPKSMSRAVARPPSKDDLAKLPKSKFVAKLV